MKLYIPGDFPTYEREADHELERAGELSVQRGIPHPMLPTIERWVPHVEYHPGPPDRGMPPGWWCRATGEH